jgi:hypothetical protein
LATEKVTAEDDLLDTFCCGIALALGNSEGYPDDRLPGEQRISKIALHAAKAQVPKRIAKG